MNVGTKLLYRVGGSRPVCTGGSCSHGCYQALLAGLKEIITPVMC